MGELVSIMRKGRHILNTNANRALNLMSLKVILMKQKIISPVSLQNQWNHTRSRGTQNRKEEKAEGKTRKIQMEKVNFNDTVKAFITLEGKNIFNTDKELLKLCMINLEIL